MARFLSFCTQMSGAFNKIKGERVIRSSKQTNRYIWNRKVHLYLKLILIIGTFEWNFPECLLCHTSKALQCRLAAMAKCCNSPLLRSRIVTGACPAAGPSASRPLSVALTHNWYTSELRSLNRYQSVADARSKVRKSLSIFSPHIQNATPPTTHPLPHPGRPLVI